MIVWWPLRRLQALAAVMRKYEINLGLCATNPVIPGVVSMCDLIRLHVTANPHTTNRVVQRHLKCCSECQASMTQQEIAPNAGDGVHQRWLNFTSNIWKVFGA